MHDSPLRSRLLLLAAAVLFSTGGAAIKAGDLTSWQVASFRSGVAAIALFTLIPEARRGWTWRVWPVGLAYSGTLVLFVLAARLTTAANAIFLQSTAPLYVMLIGPLLLKEPVRRSDLAFIGAVALGLSMFFIGTEAASATAPDPARGNLIAAVTGISWALTISGLRWQGRRQADGAVATVVAGNLIACLVALPMALPVVKVSLTDGLVIVYLGLFQIGLAYFCVTRAIRHVPAFEATALLLVEPALNPIWTWIVHGERPSTWGITGGVLILGATAVKTLWQARRSPAAVE
jgi:drug/metabolite transporter (DMT)-like permease